MRSLAPALALCAALAVGPLSAQERDPQGLAPSAELGPVATDGYRATFVRLGDPRMDALLYEPVGQAAKSVAVVFTFPRATFGAPAATELANRGYRVLLVTPYGDGDLPFDGLPETSAGVRYMRSLSGVEKVVVMSHSGGGRMMAFFTAVAEQGPAACQGPTVLTPCSTAQASGLAKPDGLVLLDPSPGAVNTASAVDPSWANRTRSRADVDMYAPANGFDPATGQAHYSAEFLRRFYAAQSARNESLIAGALARRTLLDEGRGALLGDEPLSIPGAVNGGQGVTPMYADLSIWSRTRQPHLLLKPDGTEATQIIHSIRGPLGLQSQRSSRSFASGALNYTVRTFLSGDAIRTQPDFALTEDGVTGIDWSSSIKSTPGAARNITVPTLVLTMSCYHFVTPGEIIFDNLASQDKTYASVEGALHGFEPCKPEYGDTRKRTFDFVAAWLAKPGRFRSNGDPS